VVVCHALTFGTLSLFILLRGSVNGMLRLHGDKAGMNWNEASSGVGRSVVESKVCLRHPAYHIRVFVTNKGAQCENVKTSTDMTSAVK
jgi:hypothetical protein